MNPTVALIYDWSESNKITFKLSEPSPNFGLNSISLTGGTLKYFGGANDTYTGFFYLTANSSIGNAVIKVASGAFTNAAGNANVDGNDADNSITIPVPPTVEVTYDASTSNVKFKLSGSSPNFSLNSVTVTGGRLEYFGGVHNTFGAMFYPDLNSTADGIIKVASGAFTDDAGNANIDGADANNTVTVVNTKKIASNIYLNPSQNFDLSYGNVSIFGNINNEIVNFADNISAVTTDINVESITLPYSLEDYRYQSVSGQLYIYRNSVLISKAAIQTDLDGTTIRFNNGNATSSTSNLSGPYIAKAVISGSEIKIGNGFVSPNFPTNLNYSTSANNSTPSNNLIGTAAADIITNSPTSQSIDGGAGIDTLVYTSNSTAVVISKSGVSTVVTNSATGEVDTLVNVERIKFADTAIALDTGEVGGKAYRVYQAAFNRIPDVGGLGYWIGRMDSGVSLSEVAQGFVSSAEFKALYGASPTNAQIVIKFYDNVLHRAPDSGGYNYWLGMLNSGLTFANALAAFSESPENVSGVSAVIEKGMRYTPFLAPVTLVGVGSGFDSGNASGETPGG